MKPECDLIDLIEAVMLLAGMPTTSETPGTVPDPEMDTLVMAARHIKNREGFAFADEL